MAALDLTSFDAVLKKYYSDERVRNLVYRNRPWFAMIPKKPTFRGKSFEYPITIGAIGGRSQTFSDALTAKNPSTHRRFSIPHARNYGLADIDGLTMQASVGDRAAFMEAVTSEVDSTLRQLANDVASDLYGAGTGLRGVVDASYVAGTVIPLSNDSDVHKFEVGMTLEYALAGAGVGGALEASNPTITDVDRSSSPATITISAAGTIAVGAFIFQLGDASNSGARPDKLMGLDGWLPDPATVTATPFFGVDRTEDITRLAGVFYDAVTPGDDIEEALVNAGAALFTQGGSPDMVLMHPTRVAELDRLLEQRGRYDKVQSTDADIGFEAIVVHTGGGTVRVVADPWCPTTVAYMLQTDTWNLCSIGPVPKLLTHDGNRMLRLAGADAVELRAGLYANSACSAPGWNCRIRLV